MSRKEDIDTDLYLGTVNGIDVYEVVPPKGESYLVPHDFLGEVRYGTDADGRIVQISFRDATEEEYGKLIIRFALGTKWLANEVVVLTYPPVVKEDDYE